MNLENTNNSVLETRLNNVENTLSIVLSLLEKQTPPKNDSLITVKELCAMLGTSYVTLWKRMKEGTLPYRRMGRRIYFDPVEIKELMKVNVNPSRK